jgi:hypothetical protein
MVRYVGMDVHHEFAQLTCAYAANEILDETVAATVKSGPNARD